MEGDLISHCKPAIRGEEENAKQLTRSKVFVHPKKSIWKLLPSK